jgi:hypothetical protein
MKKKASKDKNDADLKLSLEISSQALYFEEDLAKVVDSKFKSS